MKAESMSIHKCENAYSVTSSSECMVHNFTGKKAQSQGRRQKPKSHTTNNASSLKTKDIIVSRPDQGQGFEKLAIRQD